MYSCVYKYKSSASEQYTASRKHKSTKSASSSQSPNMSSYQVALASLTAREAITDALLRCYIGIDQNDAAMFESAFAGEDINLSHSSFPTPFTSLATLKDVLLTRIGPLDTLHMLTNVRIDYKDGEDTASMKAYALCQHAPTGRGKQPDGPKFTTGVDYAVDVVKGEDGLWRITNAVLEVVWTQGDHSVMIGGGPPMK